MTAIRAGRAISGYLAATALGSLLMTIPFVISEDAQSTPASICFSCGRVIDLGLLFAIVFAIGWIVSTIVAYVSFTALFWLGRLLMIWGLPYAVFTAVVSAECAVWASLFELTGWTTNFLINGYIVVQVSGLALAAGIAGGLLFWRVAVR